MKDRLSKVASAALAPLGLELRRIRIDAPNLSLVTPIPYHRNEGYRPFFIVGSGRCGSTLLRRILQAHPEVHIPPENHGLARALKSFRWSRFTDWGSAVALSLAHCEYSSGFVHFGIGLRDTAVRLKAIPEEERSLARIIASLYLDHAGGKARRWGDKTPMNIAHLDKIKLTFPDAKFIHLFRDGVDVAASMVDHDLAPSLRKAAERWSGALRLIEDAKIKWPGDILDVRYEELIAGPHALVQSVCEFLDLSYRPEMISETTHVVSMGDAARLRHHAGIAEPINVSSIGRGRKALTSDEAAVLAPLLDLHLARYGYPPVTVSERSER